MAPRYASPMAGGGAGDDAELERWAAEAVARDAADARARERWLRQQAGEEADFAGVLADLAERQALVLLTTGAGRRHRGRLAGLGLDFVALEATSGRTVLVTLEALAAVGLGGSAPSLPGPAARPRPVAPDRLRLAEVLASAAGQRPSLQLRFLSGDLEVVGRLESVGTDVVTVRVGSAPPSTLYVRLGALSEVSYLDDSG